MDAKKVVVIGSGPGGSGIAALLAHDGHAVTLMDKNGFIGGKCSALEQDGFVVDTGVHMFGCGPYGPFGQIARMVGQELKWSFREPMIDYYLSGKGSLPLAHSFMHPITLKTIFKSQAKGWMKIKPIGTLRKTLRNHSYSEIRDIWRKLFSDPYTKYLSEFEDVTVKDFFCSLTDSEDLLKWYVTQTMITMVTPWEKASLADSMYITNTVLRSKGFGYPIGGSGEIPKTFLRGFEHDGGTYRLGTEVDSIDVEKGRVKGVTTKSGETIAADIVISNAGIHRTIDMAGEKNFPKEYTERAAELKVSEAFIATKYFLDRKLTSNKTTTMFHIPDMNPFEMFAHHETGDIPKDLFLFITFPSQADPFLAPLGKDLMIVGMPAPSALSRASQCEALLDKAEYIAENKLFPEVKGHIIKKQRTHIVQTAGLSGRIGTGECIGLAQNVGQTGTKKPTPQTPIKGLYLVGSDAGGKGIGTENAANSALYLYSILK